MSIYCYGMNVPIKKYGVHSHDQWEIICQLEGDVTVTVERQTFCLSVGDLLLIPPNAARKGVSEKGFRDLTLRSDRLNFPTLTHLHDHTGEITALLQMIHRLITSQEQDYETIAESLTDAVFKMLRRELGTSANSDVERMKRLLYENLAVSDVHLSERIAETGYSQAHFKRRFKKETGMTPLQYLTELRITRAKQLLGDPRFNIEEIAHECGFSDHFYFSKCFKKHIGISPQGYRTSLLGEKR